MTETTNVAENQRLERAEIERMSPEEVEAHLDKRLKHKMLHTEGLVKRYGKRTVANGVTINVKQGEIVGLLGPNGAGKTTSFYMTTGLVIPNEGHVYIDDEEITKYPVYKRARAGIGYLPQEASVFRKLSVEDNIMSVLEMTKLTHQQQLDKLESLIAEFRLQKVRKNMGDRLSGGERRRTEIARCLAIDPKFIMLDEPFAGVDPIAVEDIQHIVWRLKYRNIGILIMIGINIYGALTYDADTKFLPFAATYLVVHNRTFAKMRKIGEGRMLNKVLGYTALNIFTFGMISTFIILGMM